MAYVTWKLIDGRGPYAYLRQSVRVEGRVTTRHLGYLGRWCADGSGAVNPGSVVTTPDGQEVRVPQFPPALLKRLGTTAESPAEKELGTTDDVHPATAPHTGRGPCRHGALEDLGTTEAKTTADNLGTTSDSGGASDGNTAPIPVRPYALPDGSWGVRSQAPLALGDLVIVTTSYGEQWTATITEVLARNREEFVARSTGRPKRTR